MVAPDTITLEMIYRAVLESKIITDSIDTRLKILNGTVRQHDTEIAVLKDWRHSQANKAIGQVGELRVEIAKMGAFGGGFGLVAGAVIVVLKVLGVA